ncbi:MAG: hypothetical protein GC180_08495 [Bacteroidetes bacterium]|nr:hypothetical protein [Bacteroidota bacterium]
MKTKMILILQVALLVLISSCSRREFLRGRGQETSQIRQVSSFKSVHLKHPAEVQIYSDSIFYVEVFDYANLVSYINSDVTGDILVIDVDRFVHMTHSKTRVVIHMPDLWETRVFGSGTIRINGPFDHLTRAEISGSGEINGSGIKSDQTLNIKISGSGKMEMSGEADNLDASISGSGKIAVFGLQTKNAYTQISGSGKVEVATSEYLEANISGSGSIIYDGNPRLSTRISGSGRVYPR